MHTIRLRGPWQIEPLQRYVTRSPGGYDATTSGLPTRDRSQMPADWRETMGHDFVGVVRYSRKFNRATILADDRVWLVVEPPRSRGHVRLNGKVLGYVRFGGDPGRFDISGLLEEHNCVDIDVEHPELDEEGNAPDDGSEFVPGGLVGEIRLELEA
jgi:hypothetical protein